ncbi:MAG: hypothetical protein Q7J85_14020 [Bacillota bacterium]|nr:hypothetical protein [Bacillota bacterium]
MRALWLTKFDYSGNTEAVILWARGLLSRELKIHLVLTGIPSSLLGVYKDYLDKYGLKNSLNIGTQQVQNLLYYSRYDLLHVYHTDLYALAENLSSSLKIPWLAGCFNEINHSSYPHLTKANSITCCSSASLQAVKDLFHPYRKIRLLLIPFGVSIKPGNFSPLDRLDILYAGPLEQNCTASFHALNEVVQKNNFCSLSVMSEQRPSGFKGSYYPWNPDLTGIFNHYNIIAGSGFHLLQGIAMGKIALILNENYGGFFSPHSTVQAHDFRSGEQAEKGEIQKLLKRDLQTLLENLPNTKKLQQENWNYAMENHNMEIIGEKIIRFYSRANHTLKS